MNIIIEIDTDPTKVNPKLYLSGVLEGTDFKDVQEHSNEFGDWKFIAHNVTESHWERVKPIIHERLTDLCDTGYIRHACMRTD